MPPWNIVASTLVRLNEDVQFMTEVAELLQRRITSLQNELRRLEAQLRSIEYQNWTDEDSPKGETVPGVRYAAGHAVRTHSVRFALDAPGPSAKLDTQGLMFTEIPIGDQTLHIPWLPQPGGTP